MVEDAGKASGWVRRLGTRRGKLAALAVVGVAVGVVAGAKVADYQRSPKAAANRSWHGKVTAIARGGADTTGGLVERGFAAPTTLGVGSEVSRGMRLSTDGRTRARIDLDDGTQLVLDRATDVAFLDEPRTMKLEAGALVADVAHVEGAPSAHILTKAGDVSIVGTKFALTAGEDRTSVEVMRGAVELRDGSAAGMVVVNAGQEGVAAKGAKLEVTPANDLAQRAAFSERLGASSIAHNEDTDAPVSGLGELRARRPGKTDEKDRAVRLSSHGVKVRIVGNVARTEIDEVFTNDTGDDLEGLYRFPLPPSSQIERLALEVDGKLVDGSFIDRAKAAAIWRGAIRNAAPQAPKPQEEIVWVPGPWHDPALLEWQRGGRFELKIFPIPKHGSRRIVIAYTETVPPVAGMRRYVYPLPQATASDMKIDNFAVDVQVIGSDPTSGVHVRGYELSHSPASDGPERLSQTMNAFTPSGDLVVEYALKDRASDATAWAYKDNTDDTDPSPSASAVKPASDRPGSVRPGSNGLPSSNDAYVALALRPRLPRWTDVRSRDQVIVVDAGRAMFGERFARGKRLAEQLTQEMDRRDRVTVLACDVTCRTLPGGFKAPGPGSAHDVDAFLAGLTPEGASDIVGAVGAALRVSDRDPQHDLRVIMISDGVASAGYRRVERVATEVKGAMPDGRAEVLTVPIGTDADVATLQEVARGGGGVLVPYAPGEPLETAALEVLNATYGTTLRDVELVLPDGLHDVAPSVVSPMRAGGESLILARMSGDHVQGEAVLRGKVGGDPFEVRYPLDVRATTDAGNAFVPRMYAAARIADRERDGGDSARVELVSLSQRFSVPSRFTSLLVLESEAMFRAFGINQDARSAAWTGESAAVQSESRSVGGGGAAEHETSASVSPAGGASLDTSDPWNGGARSTGGDGFGSGAFAPPPAAPSHSPKPATIAPRDVAPDPMGDVRAEAKAGPPPTPTLPQPPAATASAANPPPARKDAAKERLSDDAQPAPQRRRPGGQWMRREWFRKASLSADSSPAIAADRVATARAALLAAPDERARYKELVRVLAVNGALDELEETVTRWSSRDPLDADAITAHADLLARRGDRDGALRVLSGVASSTRPMSANDAAAMESALALAYERAGKAEACAFRVAAAELRPKEPEAVARAVACERARGQTASADAWMGAATGDASRARIAAQAAKLELFARSGAAPAESVGFGDVVVDASWDSVAAADLDIVVLDPAGNRLAWSARAKGVRVADATSRTHETLAMSSSAAGPFSVEVVRADGSSAPVRGRITVRSLGSSLTREFVLASWRAPVARVAVSWDSRLVPVLNAPDCNPPFVFDARGQKRLKPECF